MPAIKSAGISAGHTCPLPAYIIKGRKRNMEIAEARKLKVELETDILVLLREFTAKTGMKTERIELIKVIQAKVGMGEYSEVISVEVKMSL